jgi:HEAT repeat protein
LGASLESSDPLARYWALIVCSQFGETAKPFAKKARDLMESDPDNLVRMRAAGFLGLAGSEDPRPALTQCLKDASSFQEAAFILNTITLLHDSGYPFTLDRDWVPAEWLENRQSNVLRRFQYIEGVL